MMSETLTHEGVVRSINDGRALVAVPVQGCASCGERSRCGVGKFAAGGRITLVTVTACDGLTVGDAVTLGAEQGAINRAALLGYLLPALLIVAGAVVGDRAAHSDAAAALGAGFGLLLGLVVTRAIPRVFRSALVPLSMRRRA